MSGRELSPEEAWELLQRGEVEILDVRTSLERRTLGAPPGSRHVPLVRSVLRPQGPGVVYLCQHAIRSKLTLRRGAAEVAGGFAAWRDKGLPVEKPGG
jgi:rhodanese-related sulfurtransferase